MLYAVAAIILVVWVRVAMRDARDEGILQERSAQAQRNMEAAREADSRRLERERDERDYADLVPRLDAQRNGRSDAEWNAFLLAEMRSVGTPRFRDAIARYRRERLPIDAQIDHA